MAGSWSEVILKQAAASDLLLNALLGKKDEKGRRLRPRPEEFRGKSHAWNIVKGEGGGLKATPKSMPGGLAGVIAKHPALAAILIGTALVQSKKSEERGKVSDALRKRVRAIPYEPPSGVF